VEKPIIRSITLFFSSSIYSDNYKEYVETALRRLEELAETLAKHRYVVFSKRVSLPPAPLEDKIRVLKVLESKDILISMGYTGIHELSTNLLELVESGFYTALYGLWKNPAEYSHEAALFIHKLSDRDPVNATRVAVAMHRDPLETPYFPDSTSKGVEGIGFAFLLPRHIESFYERFRELAGYASIVKSVASELLELAKSTGFSRVFFDYSISPWMDNSVIYLLERLGYSLLKPGFLHGVALLNNLIEQMANTSGLAGGFNEVMLPYAEDDGLKSAGERGLLKARDLLLYSAVCVAGPDMIVVPASIERLAGFILDTYTLWLIKRKPLSLRVIPVSASVGEAVDLGRFGKVPVIDY